MGLARAVEVAEHVSLAAYTTMGLGGPARFFAHARYDHDVRAAWAWAREHRVGLRVLGSGSNVVADDAGIDALVVHVDTRGIEWRETVDAIEVTVAAGEPWDDLVRCAVAREWAGLECLSGIPGRVGATPIQNVGAYGQEVSDTITVVHALDRTTGDTVSLPPAECGFGYRDSRFKSAEPDRWIVMGVSYRLRPAGTPTVKYDELAKHLAARGLTAPKLSEVRESVLEIRRAKSMVLDAADPNRRSCGSFFMNPIITADHADRVAARAGAGMPRWAQPDGRAKLSAAWLIEHAGFTKGERDGAVGLSSRHTLAVVCHDGAHARDVVAFARRIRDAVAERFDVRLVPEPVLWGGLSLEN
ncbi:MAG TPA: UDP-N-acetylmuramate dehydrogenase [Methylomirabilota bacterium]|nr:UDP-N-acetylmuramate dehydrogenase [Methylomirabilota bacterium]